MYGVHTATEGELVTTSRSSDLSCSPFRAMNIPRMRRHSSAVVALVKSRCISQTSDSVIAGTGFAMFLLISLGAWDDVRAGGMTGEMFPLTGPLVWKDEGEERGEIAGRSGVCGCPEEDDTVRGARGSS